MNPYEFIGFSFLDLISFLLVTCDTTGDIMHISEILKQPETSPEEVNLKRRVRGYLTESVGETKKRVRKMLG